MERIRWRAVGAGLLLVPVLLLALGPSPARPQAVGDRVRLVERAIGVPGHPSPGNPGVSHRFPGGTTVTVTAIDAATGWFQVEDANANAAWITRTYIAQVVPAAPTPSGLCYPVGTWNLEWFHAAKTRGFPENTQGGPTYPARTPNDLTAIAAALRDALGIRILILNEINGEDREVEGEVQPRSAELDALVRELDPAFQYLIARSGNAQRVALLWDSRQVRLNAAAEIVVPPTIVQGKDLFARDPLMAHFTLLHEGQPQNDLLVVGIHLAAGQHLTRNHDAAMALLLRKLAEARAEGTVLPAGEFDVLIGGDLNASWYDDKPERLFDDLNTVEWAVLAGPNYPATRLAGVPLAPRSHLDYLIVTRKTPTRSGLLGEEIAAAEATVHQALAHGDWDTFRRVFSDHFPVTTCVGVMADND
jgi:endonuclease/exonuclease/phosphatase family metal-dependent hydrolase